jgi:hypothetical protein
MFPSRATANRSSGWLCEHHAVPDLSLEGEKLLGAPPGEFVERRKRLAGELRAAGRAEDAELVAQLRKPSAVVFAVNRAARDRPKAASAAGEAAERVAKAQVAGDAEAFERAVADLAESLDMLADVAAAHVSPGGKNPSDAMRRRVRELLRGAVADDASREQLRRGALREEVESAGFSPYAGLAPKPAARSRARASSSKAEQRKAERESKRREQLEAVEEELEAAERLLEEATRAVRDAERRRATAEREVEALRKRLARLEKE